MDKQYTRRQQEVMNGPKRFDLAQDPNTPEDMLEILSEHEISLIRWNIAENPSTSRDVLKKLINDKNHLVSASALANLIERSNLNILK